MISDFTQKKHILKNPFSSVYITGTFDKSGKILYSSKSENANINITATSLHELLSKEEVSDFLNRLTAGESSGRGFFRLNVPSPRRFFLEYRYNKETMQYLFRAIAVDDSAIVNLIRNSDTVFEIIESCPNLVVLTDYSGEIIYMNTSGFRMLNIEGRILETQSNICSLISNIDSFEQITARLKKQKVIQEIEFSFHNKDQGDLIGMTSIFTLFHEGKELICFHVADITERVKNFSGHIQNSIVLMNLNDELKRSQSQLLNQEKMASIGELSAGIAHELNNPLGYVFNNVNVLFNHMTDIQNFVNHVRDLYSSEDCISPILEQIKALDKNIDLDFIFNDLEDLKEETEEGVSRIKSIIDSLKSFSQKDSLMEFAFHNVNDSINDTLVVLKNEYKYNIEVTTELEAMPDILCSSYDLNQAFLNIIKNSIDAINEDEHSETGVINIKTHAETDSVHIYIYNSGPNIPDSIINRVFEPFFTTKSIGKGTGLGLSISHDIIVNKHNGDIRIDNLEKGVQFHISLPIVEELESEA
ncbi:MAG: ATP-binding protein [Spirochaetales bacterium]|uniref:histidine kinase n=1 Tax=Candidatus Thalassospirochaeta sargassi TaxID=3119039 RepID=A0AAJ1IC40_9SPIO|nr:ATP-binding protein [Spirochaetales bacterium]